MALGDGDTWDETNPTDSTFATQIDDYVLHLMKGIRSRLAHEHEFPDSQSATAEAGQHKFLTLQMYTTQPMTLTGTQVTGLYTKSIGTTGDSLIFVNAATKDINITNKLYYWFLDGAAETGTNMSASLYLISDAVARAARLYCKTTASGGDGIQVDINYNGASLWTATANQPIMLTTAEAIISTFATADMTAGGVLTIDVDKVGTGVAGGNITVMLEVG